MGNSKFYRPQIQVGPAPPQTKSSEVVSNSEGKEVKIELTSKGQWVDARYTRAYFLLPILDEEFFQFGKRPPTDGEPPKTECSPYLTAIQSISDHVNEVSQSDRPYTDVFIFSHGWHRNFYSASSGYDRLVSRFVDLYYRSIEIETVGDCPGPPVRLSHPIRDSKNGETGENGFNPLLIGLHYHSDPGTDSFLDFSGRKEREDFLKRIRTEIRPKVPGARSEAILTSRFEDLYEIFTKLTAPEVDPDAIGIKSDSRICWFGDYTLFGTLREDLPDSVLLTTAWSCYHESNLQQTGSEQLILPARTLGFAGWSTALTSIALFLLVPIFTVLKLLGLTEGLEKGLKKVIENFNTDWLPVVQGKIGFNIPGWLFVLFATWILLWTILRLVISWNTESVYTDGQGVGDTLQTRSQRSRAQARGMRMLGNIVYLPLQLIHAIPLVVWTAISPVLSGRSLQVIISGLLGLQMAKSLFPKSFLEDWSGLEAVTLSILTVILFVSVLLTNYLRSYFAPERSGPVGKQPIPRHMRRKSARMVAKLFNWLRMGLSWFAVLPIKYAKKCVRKDQTIRNSWDTIESQLAFWDMAERAVDVGEYAAKAIEMIASKSDGWSENMRVHIVGHSHGGIVSCNLAKWLSYATKNVDANPNCDKVKPVLPNFKGTVQTLVTINGAYMTSWFEGEKRMVDGISGAIASCYSKYDTANNFLYPLANIGRMSAGSVGHWLRKLQPPIIGDPLPSVALTTAHLGDMDRRLNFVGTSPGVVKFLNVDCSRFVCKGPVLPQGSHGDIYQKDVLATVWRIVLFGEARVEDQDIRDQ
jgi:hypothetical protein